MVQAVLESPKARARVLPLSLQAYHDLSERGLIPERAELLHGVIFEKMPKSRFHVRLVRYLEAILRNQLPAGYLLQKEDPITCSDSEPEPDLALIRGAESDFVDSHPTTAELVIEVSISTEDTDRSKAEIYAEAGVKEYWLVLPNNRTIEVYTEPSSRGYLSHEVMVSHAASKVLPSLRVAMSDLFEQA